MIENEQPLATVFNSIYQDINQLGLDNKKYNKYVVLEIDKLDLSVQTDFCVQSDKDF